MSESAFITKIYPILADLSPIIWWGMIGERLDNKFLFWKIFTLDHEVLEEIDKLADIADDISPDLAFETPFIPDYVDFNDRYLAVANNGGETIIYRDGSSEPFKTRNILEIPDEEDPSIHNFYLHYKYLIVDLSNVDCADVHIYNLEDFSLSDMIFLHEEANYPLYVGRYIFKIDDYDRNENPTGIGFYDLDNRREIQSSLPEEFTNFEVCPLEYQGKLLFHEESSEKTRQYLRCYDIDEDKIIWKISLEESYSHPFNCCVDLRDAKFMIYSLDPRDSKQPFLIYDANTGQILERIPHDSFSIHYKTIIDYSRTLSVPSKIYPTLIPDTNQIKYIIV